MRRLKSEYDSLPLAESKLSLLLGIIAVIGTIYGLVNYFRVDDPKPQNKTQPKEPIDPAPQTDKGSDPSAPPTNPDDPFPNTNQAQQEFTEGQSAK